MPKSSKEPELEQWIMEQFPTMGFNAKGEYCPRHAFQKKLVRAHPIQSDAMTKKIVRLSNSLWPTLVTYETPEEQERLIRSAYNEGGKRKRSQGGGGFVGKEQFRAFIISYLQISPTKPKHAAKRQLIDVLLARYESQLISGHFTGPLNIGTVAGGSDDGFGNGLQTEPVHSTWDSGVSLSNSEPAWEAAPTHATPTDTANNWANLDMYSAAVDSWGTPNMHQTVTDTQATPQTHQTVRDLLQAHRTVGQWGVNPNSIWKTTPNLWVNGYEHSTAADSWATPEVHPTAAETLSQPQVQVESNGWQSGVQVQNHNLYEGLGTRLQNHMPPNSEIHAYPNVRPATPEASSSRYSQLPTPFTRTARVAPTSASGADVEIDYPDLPSLEEQNSLLNDEVKVEASSSTLSNAVVFSAELLRTMKGRRLVGQYSLLGTLVESVEGFSDGIRLEQQENRLFLNTNLPTSFFICGLQGSGKSHTLSCLLENYLIPSNLLGVLKSPLSALVLHYDPFSTKEAFRPCEAVFLAGLDPAFPGQPRVNSVNVLVSPSNFHSMRAAYGQVPHVTVRALRLRPRDLTCGSMQSLMSVDQSQAVPLYMSQVVRILREMSAQSAVFDYRDFKKRLNDQRFKGAQKEMLEQRLSLLESFLDLGPQHPGDTLLEDSPGALTIVDLSCPFVNKDTACVLFNICVELYLSSPKATGKVIAVDEAHKYMTDTPGARVLTEQLLAIIRLQRHCNARVIVATQEPTVSPLLIGLTSVKIIHRFSSIDWYQALDKHLPQRGKVDNNQFDTRKKTYFDWIAQLQRGQAVVFDPSAILGGNRPKTSQGLEDLIPLDDEVTTSVASSVYDRCFVIKIRKRMTLDGGRSIVCISDEYQ